MASNSDAFPERLRLLFAGQSVRAIARKCGLSEGAIRQYLAGKSEPSRIALISLACALNVDVGYLATGEGPTKKGEEDLEQAPRQEYKEINPQVMREIVEGVEGYLTENKLQMPADKKAELLIYLYEVFAKEGQVDRGQVIRLVKMMAA